mgnify:CR=1 FL=1
MTSDFKSLLSWCLRHLFLNATATARLASFWPTINLFNCSTTSFGFNAANKAGLLLLLSDLFTSLSLFSTTIGGVLSTGDFYIIK